MTAAMIPNNQSRLRPSLASLSTSRSLVSTSAAVILISAIVMTGSLLLQSNGNSSPVLLLGINNIEKMLFHWARPDKSTTSSSFHSKITPSELMSLATIGDEGIPETLTEQDLLPRQHHRRLKRITKNNHDMADKVARKNARAKADGQSKTNATAIQLPPILEWEFEIDEPTFPNELAASRYQNASKYFLDAAMRSQLDPLGQVQQQKQQQQQGSNSLTTLSRVPFTPQVEYLGVLIDAGRHHFPIGWLKRLIVYLHRLRFNMVHFRLTDDQNFNLRLESYPQLAFVSPPSAATTAGINDVGMEDEAIQRHHDITSSQGLRRDKAHHTRKDRSNVYGSARTKANQTLQAYTPSELRELVAFAKDHGIVMIPEINIPGHAGAWAGIPNLVLNCPDFVCNKGYGIPLNVEHPQLRNILKSVIREVLDIFDNPPLLHLGGDEVFVSKKCFEELKRDPFNYAAFEEELRQVVVNDIGYPEDQILRWEATEPSSGSTSVETEQPRTGTIQHFWLSLPGTRKNVNTGQVLELSPPQHPFFVSHKLYMDTNHNHGAGDIFNNTIEDFQITRGLSFHPLGIVAGAFELDVDFWVQRNVAARLIAVSMGAARLNFTTDGDFWDLYNHTCRKTLGLEPAVCDLQGYVSVEKSRYQRRWKRVWSDWTNTVCNRLTIPTQKLNFKNTASARKHAFENSNAYFWRTLKEPLKQPAMHTFTDDKAATRMGVILDFANSRQSSAQTSRILKDVISPLGIQLVQLRLADNHAFALNLEEKSVVGFSPLATQSKPLPDAAEFATIVSTANELGIEVYPEISLTTSTGGWMESGFLLDCPTVLCDRNASQKVLANDIGRKDFLPVAYSVIRSMKALFYTSRLIHLGGDERQSSVACFQEADHLGGPPFSSFERKLKTLLTTFVGISTENIIRWENRENVRYPDRAGDITHYRSTNPFVLPRIRPQESFFVTIDVLAPFPQKGSPQTVFYEIYKRTRDLMKLKPLGIFAELRMLGDVTWQDYSVGLRLVAFSIGAKQSADSGDDYTKEDFTKRLSDECKHAKLEHCVIEEDDTLTKQKDEDLVYLLESDFVRKRVCDKHTLLSTKREPKPKIQKSY